MGVIVGEKTGHNTEQDKNISEAVKGEAVGPGTLFALRHETINRTAEKALESDLYYTHRRLVEMDVI